MILLSHFHIAKPMPNIGCTFDNIVCRMSKTVIVSKFCRSHIVLVQPTFFPKGFDFTDIKKIAIIGDTKRQRATAEAFAKDGVEIAVCGDFDGFDANAAITKCNDLSSAVGKAQAIILPFPVTRDGLYIEGSKISLDELFSVCDHIPLLGGGVDTHLRTAAASYGVGITDYFEREELKIYNAVPSAEGAIFVAMKLMEKTLFSSEALILGFGRLSKALSSRLLALGCRVRVIARSKRDLAQIAALGYSHGDFSQLAKFAATADVIFNTVPAKVMGEDIIEATKPDCTIIDLASNPGGVDRECLALSERKFEWALGLPGKLFPKTAGEYIKTAVENIINERDEPS